MRRWGPLIAALSFMVLGSTAFAKDKHPQPTVYVLRDDPHQETHLLLEKIPEQCVGSILTSRMCWRVYPITSQSYSKTKKSIQLLVGVSTSADDLQFNQAALTFAIDGAVLRSNGRLTWEFSGGIIPEMYTILADEQLVRKLAAANEVWVTAETRGLFSVKLSPEVLTGIRAVLDRYDELEPKNSSSIERTGSELEDINIKLSALDAESAGIQKRAEALNAKCSNPSSSKSCLLSAKELISVAQSCATRTLHLANKKLAILDQASDRNATLEERTKTLQVRDEAAKALVVLNQSSKAVDEDLSSATEP